MALLRFPSLTDVPSADRERLWEEASRPKGFLAPRLLYLTLLPSMLFCFWLGWTLYEFWGALIVGGLGTILAAYAHALFRIFIIKRRVIKRLQSSKANLRV